MPLPVRQSACPHNHFHSKAISRFAVSFRKEGVLLDEKVGQEEGNVVEGAAIWERAVLEMTDTGRNSEEWNGEGKECEKKRS